MEPKKSKSRPIDPKLAIKKRNYDLQHFSVKVRYDKEQEKKVKANAEKAGKEVTTYVREVSLNPSFKIIPPPPMINKETKAEILKIGINLNQIARALNNYYEQKSFTKISNNLDEMNKKLQTILEKLEV